MLVAEEKKIRNYQYAPGDDRILSEFRKNPQLTPTLLSALAERSLRTTRYRLRALRQLGYLQEDGQSRFIEAVHYPTRKGWDYIHAKGWIPEAVGMGDPLSARDFAHNLNLARLELVFRREFPARKWEYESESLRKFLYVNFKESSVNPDRRFVIRDPERETLCFLEWEESDETHDSQGRLKIDGLSEDYDLFYRSGEVKKRYGFDTFRVCFVLPTMTKARNKVIHLKLKAHEEKNPAYDAERIYITWKDAALENPAGFIFMTPKYGPEKHFNFFGDTAK